jgi:hypothetical protein
MVMFQKGETRKNLDRAGKLQGERAEILRIRLHE